MFEYSRPKTPRRPEGPFDGLIPISDHEGWDWVIFALEMMGHEQPDVMVIPVPVPEHDSYIFWITDPASARVRW